MSGFRSYVGASSRRWHVGNRSRSHGRYRRPRPTRPGSDARPSEGGPSLAWGQGPLRLALRRLSARPLAGAPVFAPPRPCGGRPVPASTGGAGEGPNLPDRALPRWAVNPLPGRLSEGRVGASAPFRLPEVLLPLLGSRVLTDRGSGGVPRKRSAGEGSPWTSWGVEPRRGEGEGREVSEGRGRPNKTLGSRTPLEPP